jgi:hypothetical protein
VIILPVIVVVLRWTASGLATSPLDGRFWYALLCAAAALGPYVLVSMLAIKERT